MKTTTLLSLFLFSALSLRAEQSDDRAVASSAPFSLGEVTRLVLENNPAIKEAESRWRAAKERIPQAAAWDDLRIGAESEFKRFVNIAPNAFMDQSLTVEQMVPLTGKNLVRARIAAAEALSAFEETRRAKLEVIAKARSAFFRLANAEDQLAINDQNLVSLRQIAEISRSRYATGQESAAHVLVAETEQSKLQETRRDLERNLSDAQSQLNALMNRDPFAPVAVITSSPRAARDLSLNQLRAIALAQRPEIQIARSKIAAEKSKLQLAHRAWIPDPALSVKAQRYNDAAQSVSELDAGVSFTVPWVNPAKYSAGVREARENTSAAEEALDREQKEGLRLLRDQLEKIETAHHHVELFRDKLVPQAQQAFEANRFSYESGKASFLDWIAAQRNLRDLEAAAREHVAEYEIALAELETVIGAQIYSPSDEPRRPRKFP